jgi:hypothetical protein
MLRRSLVRLIFRWTIRFVTIMFFLATTSLTSIWVGVPTSVTRISDHWAREATAAGVPLAYHPFLRRAASVVASITLVLGWLVLASFTVFLLRIIF